MQGRINQMTTEDKVSDVTPAIRRSIINGDGLPCPLSKAHKASLGVPPFGGHQMKPNSAGRRLGLVYQARRVPVGRSHRLPILSERLGVLAPEFGSCSGAQHPRALGGLTKIRQRLPILMQRLGHVLASRIDDSL